MPITLTVEPKEERSFSPALFIRSPLQPPGYPLKTADQLGPDVCLASDFHPTKKHAMVLNVRGGPDSRNITRPVLSVSGTYYFAGFSNQTIHSCELGSAHANNEAEHLCEDVFAEKAKLNFYLLSMNAVRVVFTKITALGTILTVRGLLF